MKRDFRKTLKHLNELQKLHKPFNETDFVNSVHIHDRDKAAQIFKELKTTGYLDTLVVSETKTVLKVELSYRGMTYREDNRALFLRRCFDWFTQNLVGLAALVVSIIALIRSL